MRNKRWHTAALCVAVYAKYVLCTLIVILIGAGSFGCGTDMLINEGECITVEKAETPDINDVTLQDNPYVYVYDDEDSVVTMYLTVRMGNKGENTYHTWSEINGYSIFDYEKMGVDRYKAECILQVGNENGPVAGELGYGLKIPNATVQIRGNTSSKMVQKSYKIVLDEESESWRDQKTIALNKHAFDGMRFRNKLCFDLIKNIPDMISLRTQFVHLYVKDETKDTPDTAFVDYGLYTHVEQPNTRFLKNHGLDTNGQFYKANFFEFERYENAIKLKTDPTYLIDDFEKYLEIKGNDDHSKLIEMLDALNDYTRPVEDIFEKYFDSDNYFTWMAFSILMGDIDTQSRNFYLYSPQNSDTWYFISWDRDNTLARYEYQNIMNTSDFGFEAGISNYWGSVLANRVLREEKYRKILDDKINLLREYLTKERIMSMAQSYRTVTENYIYSMPDIMYARLTPKLYSQVFETLSDEIDTNYQLYLDSLKKPMPFYLGLPEIRENETYFQWDTAYDLDGQAIQYTFELAEDLNFEDVISKQEGLLFPDTTTVKLPAGQYFFRVSAKNEDGESQLAMDYYVTHSIAYYGILSFYVLSSGEVVLNAS